MYSALAAQLRTSLYGSCKASSSLSFEGSGNYYQVGIHVHVSCRKVKGRCQIANSGYCVAPFIVNFFAGPLDFTIMRVDCNL